MAYSINDLIIGKITSVKPYALFLTFEDGSKGLLHISEISNNFIRDIERFGSVNDEIKVKVLSIDPTNGFLRVSLKQVPENERYSTHVGSKKSVYNVGKNDFTSLKEHLPIWIEKALKEK